VHTHAHGPNAPTRSAICPVARAHFIYRRTGARQRGTTVGSHHVMLWSAAEAASGSCQQTSPRLDHLGKLLTFADGVPCVRIVCSLTRIAHAMLRSDLILVYLGSLCKHAYTVAFTMLTDLEMATPLGQGFGHPKMSFLAMKTSNEMLEGYSLVGRIPLSAPCHAPSQPSLSTAADQVHVAVWPRVYRWFTQSWQ
jgi:hypothetical protein